MSQQQQPQQQQQKDKDVWDREPGTVKFGPYTELPAAPGICVYGGGAAFEQGVPIVSMKLPKDRIPTHLIPKVSKHINDAIKNYISIPKDNRTVKLPDKTYDNLEKCLMDDNDENWIKSCHLFIGFGFFETNTINLMHQSWLFEDVTKDPSRIGAQSYPLIGIYDTYGVQKPPNMNNPNFVSGIKIFCLFVQGYLGEG